MSFMGKEIEEAFETTSGVVLGRKLSVLDDYTEWLGRYTDADPIRAKSAVSTNTVYAANTFFYRSVKKNMVKLDESLQLGERKIDREMIGKLTLSNAGQILSGIKYTTPEGIVEPNIGMEECTLYGYCSYCYKATAMVETKYSAFSFWPRQSEYVFGCRYCFSSKFCINCYYSVNLTRCFEMLDCNNCSDSYFCHNSEGLSNCMFCFNSKSLRYAIGNVEVGKEEYVRVKKILLDAIGKQLEKDKDLKLSIYNLRV